eukprot:gene9648-676_t
MSCEWLAPFATNPFAPPATSVAAPSLPAAPAPAPPPKQKAVKTETKTAVGAKPEPAKRRGSGNKSKSPVMATSGDSREDAKMNQYLRQFQLMEEKEDRKRKFEEDKRQKEALDPCTCGRSQSRPRLPRPLAPGGPRCTRCTPLPRGAAEHGLFPREGSSSGSGSPPSKPIELPAASRRTPGRPSAASPPGAGAGAAGEVRDAPIFHPTEEEFKDPMAYIRSVQAEAYDFGIFLIQPPPSWKPPTSREGATFHRHRDLDSEATALAPPRKRDRETHTDSAGSEGDEEGEEEEQGEEAAAASDPLLRRPDTSSLLSPAKVSANPAADGAGGEEPPPMARMPSASSAMPSSADYLPITEADAFDSRLQAIKPRRAAGDEESASAGPFICSFTPRFAKYSLSEFKAMD